MVKDSEFNGTCKWALTPKGPFALDDNLKTSSIDNTDNA